MSRIHKTMAERGAAIEREAFLKDDGAPRLS